jgi:phage gpG-like protein
MAEIIISAAGFERVFAVLDRLENPQWERLMNLIGLTVEEQTVNHFQQQAGPEGPWAPRSGGGSWPVLVKTGTLRASITHAPLSETEVAIGTHLFYGRFHQEGTRMTPRRMFLGLTDTDKDQLQRVVESYLEGLTR